MKAFVIHVFLLAIFQVGDVLGGEKEGECNDKAKNCPGLLWKSHLRFASPPIRSKLFFGKEKDYY